MDDLISRKAAVEAIRAWAEQPVIRKSRDFEPKGKAIVLDMIGVVTEQPSVPAVPLDKLCEWLRENALLSYKTPLSIAGWKYELTQWMEEQDATD